ncbi:Molybdopterin synthase catalytic subunit [Planctomycetes bacterium Pan216]|uniref:Molybdopterin synthase catalytic subunit n=1 Tax=Kolteria novifilia TaxID=2527975 RepID=A0A518BAT6_9BACT|nr:Molybdopterin synthase catalytic subunit [Planctomycetes bacterium Pan216]
MIKLTKDTIDYHQLVEEARGNAFGAVVLFLGTVREMSEGRRVDALDYDAYPPMAEKELRGVVDEARQRWPLGEVSVIHRYGHLDLGDIAVAVVTASAHRAEAFAGAQWIMETIKERVPIWKRENWSDGSARWVHPQSAPTNDHDHP